MLTSLRRLPALACASLLALCLAVASTPARAQSRAPEDRALRSGLALGSAIGTDNVGFGVHALYYQQLSERWRVAPHLGFGWYFLGSSWPSGVAAGVMASFGRRHRLLLDVYTAPLNHEALSVHGTVLDERLLYGVGLNVGWEWMSHYGLFVRASVGPATYIVPDAPLREGHARFAVRGNLLALGYKLW